MQIVVSYSIDTSFGSSTSGLEVAGVVLGAFPLLISGIEHWREIAKVGGFFWQIRKEYTKCQREVQFHQIIYKKNLEELLLPLVPDADEVAKLIADPGGHTWTNTALQERLEGRLHESYQLFQDTITDMNEIMEGLKKELCFEKKNVQDKLLTPETNRRSTSRSPTPQQSTRPSKLSAVKGRLEYETFRTKFSFGEKVRSELFFQLKECNERLEKLLSSSDRVSALQDATPGPHKQTSVLESAFKTSSKKSYKLFEALQNAWQCSCQQYHFANLRLEHRTLQETCFDIILMFMAPSMHDKTPWYWKEIRCGHLLGYSSPPGKVDVASFSPSNFRDQSTTLPTPATVSPTEITRRRKVGFKTPTSSVPNIELALLANYNIRLCQLLGDGKCGQCIGIIGQEDEVFHLHSIHTKRQIVANATITLDQILSNNLEGHLSRRQRYSIALLIASTVGQLQSTPWIRSGLCKEDIFFFPSDGDKSMLPYGEPFIRQGFPHDHTSLASNSAEHCNFYSLGILLLELCFGRRLQDSPLRKKYPPTTDTVTENAFDVMPALDWSRMVSDEGGDDYASAVKWCFTSATERDQNWRGELVRNVVRPLEMCMKHFQSAHCAQ